MQKAVVFDYGRRKGQRFVFEAPRIAQHAVVAYKNQFVAPNIIGCLPIGWNLKQAVPPDCYQ